MAGRLVPDLILLDLYLPDVFGLDLLNQMRVAGVEGDVIVISAANESETVERALKLGVTNYLLKPFTLDDLAGRLSEYRSQRQRRLRPLVGGQAEVDRIFGRSEPTITESLPKGMSPETAELILATLRERSEEQSAQQCAAAVGDLSGERPPIPGVLRLPRQGPGVASVRQSRSSRAPIPAFLG